MVVFLVRVDSITQQLKDQLQVLTKLDSSLVIRQINPDPYCSLVIVAKLVQIKALAKELDLSIKRV